MLAVALAVHPSPALAFGDFLCAGPADGRPAPSHLPVAGKLSQAGPRGIQALVLFAGFSDTDSEQARLPDWSSRLFDLDHPGSFSHFFRTMSFDGFQPRGQVAPSQYLSRQAVSFYVSSDSNKPGSYGQFSRDILSQADGDLDFALFDSDGPDGIANSGDDDGVVDAVFIILDRVPLNFLQGAATGVASLGLHEDWLTDDVGASGRPIRIASPQGVVLQGRTFAETAGVMCHEYGHGLGLPDLFNTAFVQEKDAGPADDSAGIGNWGLMGWGATGWHGDAGPNSFSAWSRMKLGWTLPREISQAQEELRLPEIGSSGDVYSIPLGAGEFFLLEHRRNTSTHYDRNIPGEGLLIWHVDHDGPALESADGRWLDAGFPDGRQPDQDGGDNLDFWAHDGAYSDRHAGNKGDATDPFDGERFNAFTAETNPAAYNSRRSHSIQIEDIHIDGDVAVAHVRTQPAVIELFFPRVSDASKDGILTADEEGQVYFHVVNRGGLVARNVRVSLTTEEPLLEVIQADAFLGDIQVGRASARPVDGGGFPRIRLGSDFSGTRPLEIRRDERVPDRCRVLLSPYRQSNGQPGQRPAEHRRQPLPLRDRQSAVVHRHYGRRRIIRTRAAPRPLLLLHGCQGSRLRGAVWPLPDARGCKPRDHSVRRIPGLGYRDRFLGHATGDGVSRRPLAHWFILHQYIRGRRLYADASPRPTRDIR